MFILVNNPIHIIPLMIRKNRIRTKLVMETSVCKENKLGSVDMTAVIKPIMIPVISKIKFSVKMILYIEICL